jgi:hypothetical protein
MHLSRVFVPAMMLAARSLHAQTLQEFTPTAPAKAQVVVFASGNAKAVIAQPKDAASASGSLGMTYVGNNFIVAGVVNALPKSDSLTWRAIDLTRKFRSGNSAMASGAHRCH